jgi:tetratricopeptide (TPR) repeat protein
LSILAHGTALLVLVAMLAWAYWGVRASVWRARGLRVALILVGVAPCLGLTTLHNALASGHFIPLTTNAGRNFFIGNNPTATGTFKFYDFGIKGSALAHYLLDNQRAGGNPAPSEASRRALRSALHFALENPGQELRLLAHKAGLLLNRLELSTRYNFYYARARSDTLRLAFLGFGWVAPLGLVGLVLLARRSPGHLAVSIFGACQLIAFTLTFVLGRYRVVGAACLIVGLALFVPWLVELARARRWPAVAGVACAVLLAAVVVHRPLDGFDEKRGWGTLHLHAGTVYMDRGQFDRAEEVLRKAVHEDFAPLELQHMWRAKAHARLGDLHVQRGELEQALSAYREGLAEVRNEVPGNQRRGSIHYLRERIRSVESAIGATPETSPSVARENPREVPGS